MWVFCSLLSLLEIFYRVDPDFLHGASPQETDEDEIGPGDLPVES